MDWIFELLFGWWWYAKDGRTKSADATQSYVLPLLILCLLIGLVGMLVWVVRK